MTLSHEVSREETKHEVETIRWRKRREACQPKSAASENPAPWRPLFRPCQNFVAVAMHWDRLRYCAIPMRRIENYSIRDEHPDYSQNAEHDEWHLPAISACQPDRQRNNEKRSKRNPCQHKARGPPPLGKRQPLADQLPGGRKHRTLTSTEEQTKNEEGSKTPRHCSRRDKHRPQSNKPIVRAASP